MNVYVGRTEAKQEKKEAQSQKSIDKLEKKDELAREADKKNMELNKKLKQAEKRRNELINKNADKLKRVIEKEHQTLIKVLDNNRKLHEERVMCHTQILEKQYVSIERANLKEASLHLNKQNV
jgi:molecular chaperone GrpE (heat shock protein)